MSIRHLISKFLSISRLVKFANFIDNLRPSLKVLAYHRVLDCDESNYLFDKELISASCDQFEQQVKYLIKNYTVKTFSESVKEYKDKRTKNIVSITFDDGFDDFYYNAFPILKKYKATATVFITTGLIGSSELLWPEKVVYALNKNPGKVINLEPFISHYTIEHDNKRRRLVIDKLLKELKALPNHERIELILSLESQLGAADQEVMKMSRMLNWDMIKEMHDYGIEFGSHTVTHPVLSTLSEADLINELKDSKHEIETMLHHECTTIAFPVGGRGAFNDMVINKVKELEYKYACNYMQGINMYDTMDIYSLKRLHVEHELDIHWFKAMVSLPSICAANYQ